MHLGHMPRWATEPHDDRMEKARVTTIPGTGPGIVSASRVLASSLGGAAFLEGAAQVVPELDLDAVAFHDEGLLRHREKVVPGPVDHEARRERAQHEGEDHRHPGENLLL